MNRIDVTFESRTGGLQDLRVVSQGFLLERRRGVRIPAFICSDAVRDAEGPSPHTLVVHEQGESALLSSDGKTPGALLRDLAAKGCEVMAIDVFGVGEAKGEQDPKEPRGSTKFFATFNRTDTAERVWDTIATISFYAKAIQAGSPQAPRRDSVNVIGVGRAGLWCLLACAVLNTSSQDLPPMRIVIDADQFDTSREESYREDLYVPGILRAGGLPAAAALIPPARLFLHNTGDRFDTLWLKDVQSTLPGSRVVIQKDKATDDAIVKWLTGP